MPYASPPSMIVWPKITKSIKSQSIKTKKQLSNPDEYFFTQITILKKGFKRSFTPRNNLS